MCTIPLIADWCPWFDIFLRNFSQFPRQPKDFSELGWVGAKDFDPTEKERETTF